MATAFANSAFWRGRLRWLPHYAARVASGPSRELRRLQAYSRSTGRDAFISFQHQYVSSLLPAVRRLRPRIPSTEPTSRVSARRELDLDAKPRDSLRELFIKYGSDKSTLHDYDVIYESFAHERGVPETVLEIGLGTSSSLPSTMGPLGSPGASARAFRDWGAFVVGCDIDKQTLFSEPGILTVHMDQLAPRTFRKLERVVEALGDLDLVVIDGLHTPEADLNSLLLLAPWLSPSGVLVVEDVENDSQILAMWRDVLEALPSDFCALDVTTKAATVILVGRPPFWSPKRLRGLYNSTH